MLKQASFRLDCALLFGGIGFAGGATKLVGLLQVCWLRLYFGCRLATTKQHSPTSTITPNYEEWPALPTSNNAHNTIMEAPSKATMETAAEQKKEIEHLSQVVETQQHHINAIQEQQQQQQQQ